MNAIEPVILVGVVILISIFKRMVSCCFLNRCMRLKTCAYGIFITQHAFFSALRVQCVFSDSPSRTVTSSKP